MLFGDLTSPEKRRTWWVLGLMTASILTLLVDSLLGPSIVSAEIWGYGFTIVFIVLAYVLKDELLKKLLLFGVLAGFAELVADHYLVGYTKTLIYPPNEPFLWSSPAYMPFSWCVVLVEFGYIAWLLNRKLSVVKAGFILAIMGALLVPLYEHWAITSGWWSYQSTPMLGPVPYYVILAEGLLMIPIPYFVRALENKDYGASVVYAIGEGIVMLVACLLACAIFGYG